MLDLWAASFNYTIRKLAGIIFLPDRLSGLFNKLKVEPRNINDTLAPIADASDTKFIINPLLAAWKKINRS